ncbi:hypothetical protein [Methyloglobulus sp.]
MALTESGNALIIFHIHLLRLIQANEILKTQRGNQIHIIVKHFI